jgi:branched-chain amino acid transport system permease protein
MADPTGPRSNPGVVEEGPASAQWHRQPFLWRRVVPAVLIAALLLALAGADVLRQSTEVYLIVVAVLLLFLARAAFANFWRALDQIGVEDGRSRWQAQSPLVQRAVPPVVIAVGVILIAWAAGTQPDPSLVVLLAITYGLYLMPAGWRRIALPVTVLLLVVAYPFFIQQTDYQRFLFKLPIFSVFPSMDTMVSMLIFAMMAIGLNMVVGYAGLLDLGYVAFYAIGAYTAAWLASPHFAAYGVHLDFGSVAESGILSVGGIHLSIWLVLIIAGVVTAAVGVIIGLPTLRLRGDYLAIVTLGFGEILPQVARNGDKDGLGFNLTNGPPGINPIDPPGFGNWLSAHVGVPSSYLREQGLYVNFLSLMFWTALGLLLITMFCSVRLRDSRLGRAWIAIREDETAAAAMGIPLMRTKTWAYASGAFFGGVAGAWFASIKTGVFPDDFFFNISVLILCMVILGGMGNVLGVVAGAAVLEYLNLEGIANFNGWMNEHVLVCDPNKQDSSAVISGGCLNAPLVTFGIYGAIIVLVMLTRPQGIFPEQRRKLEFETGVHDTPIQDVSA